MGDTYQMGRWKGNVIESGYVRLRPETGTLDDFVRQLYSMRGLIIGNGADTRVLHITLWYEDQCNLEFKPEVMRMIAEMDLTLAISCA